MNNLKCSFSSTKVTAVVINNERALCISPMLPSAGLITLELLNGTENIGTTTFHARKFTILITLCIVAIG